MDIVDAKQLIIATHRAKDAFRLSTGLTPNVIILSQPHEFALKVSNMSLNLFGQLTSLRVYVSETAPTSLVTYAIDL